MIIPEIIIHNTLNAIIKVIRDDFDAASSEQDTILYRLFADEKLERYELFEQAKTVFLKKEHETPRALSVNLSFNSEKASIPSIHITTPADQPGADGIGVDEGYQDPVLDENGDIQKTYTRRFNGRVNITFTSDNSSEALLLFYGFRALLIPIFDHLSLSGIENVKLSSSELNFNPNYVPAHIFGRSIVVQFQYDTNVNIYKKLLAINTLIFNSELFPETQTDTCEALLASITSSQIVNCVVPGSDPLDVIAGIYNNEGLEAAIIEEFGGGGGTCDHATWSLVNSQDTELATGSIPSGASEEIIAPQGNVALNNSAGNLPQVINVPSGVTVNDVYPDTIVTVQYDDGTPIDVETLPSGVAATIDVTPFTLSLPQAPYLEDVIANTIVLIQDEAGVDFSDLNISVVIDGNTLEVRLADFTARWVYEGGFVPFSFARRGSLFVEPQDSDGNRLPEPVITQPGSGQLIATYTDIAFEINDVDIPDLAIPRSAVLVQLGIVNNFGATVGSWDVVKFVIADSTFSINGTQVATIVAEGSGSIQVRRETGSTQVGSLQGQHWRVADSSVENSDGTYDVTVVAEGSLILPDSQVNVNTIDEGDVVSVKPMNIFITDGTDPVTPDSVGIVGNDVTIAVPSGGGGGGIPSALPAPTASETDEDTGANAYVPGTFHTLPYNNPFGTTSRRTGTAGGYYDYDTDQYKLLDGTVTNRAGAFGGPRFIDWLQWDKAAGKVMMYQVVGNSIYTYADIITMINGMSNGGYTDWFLPTLGQYYDQLRKGGTNRGMNYAPIEDNGGADSGLFWTSTTGLGGTDKMVIANNGSTTGNRNPKQLGRSMLVGRWADVPGDITL